MRVWVGAVLLAATGCGRSGVPIGEEVGDADIPFPEGIPGNPGVPGPVIDTGRGLDGPIVFDGALTEFDDCEVVVDASGTQLQLASAFAPFGDGRRIVLAQMNDQIAYSSGETEPVTDFKSAGDWEIAEILTRSGTDVTLTAPLKSAYASNLVGLRAQACLVHEWTDVTLAPNAIVSPSEWNGLTGGIFAAQISGVLFVDGNSKLTATASGFRGGLCGLPSGEANVDDYEVTEGYGGGKGEGLDARFFVKFGRGAATNGGGGGNGLNAGGGGGGGAGRGGNGGRQKGNASDVIFGEEVTHGIAGGAAMDSTRLVFGGGGGAGHLDSVTMTVCGGAGGGALVIRAAAIAGTGWISADGGDGRQLNRNGGGGGGAGGTVDLVTANSTLFVGWITADGGEGGDVTAGFFTNTTYGPGGGGGGGHVRASGVTPSSLIRARGGIPGTNEQNGAFAGASDGRDGLVVFP